MIRLQQSQPPMSRGDLPMNDESCFNSVFAMHAAGGLGAAELGYRRLLDHNPQHVEALHYLGVLLHQQGNTPEGIALILNGLELEAVASRYNDLGNILAQTEDYANAATAFRLSLELHGDDANVWNNFGSIMHRQQDYANAENAYRNALLCNADFVPALNNLAALLAETGRSEESALLACRAFVLPPLDGKTPKMLGIAHYRLGRIEAAAAHFRHWLHAEPDNALARQHLDACADAGPAAPSAADHAVADLAAASGSVEETLAGRLAYRGHEAVAGLLNGYAVAEGALDILDCGCADGLCAPVLLPYARHLTAVDCGAGVLVKARQCKLYSELVEADLTAYLKTRKGAFDMIVMADALNDFCDLEAPLQAVRRALRTDGAFVFAIETTPARSGAAARAAAGARQLPGRSELAHLLDDAGFAILRENDITLRRDGGQSAPGIAVLARAMPLYRYLDRRMAWAPGVRAGDQSVACRPLV